MGDDDIKASYYQSQLDRIDSDIEKYDEIILDAQERKRAAMELRGLLLNQMGGDSQKPITKFQDLSVRKAVPLAPWRRVKTRGLIP